MPMRRALFCAALACAALSGALAATGGGAATGRGTTIAALGGVAAGLWQVRAEGASPRTFCLADPAALTQLRHAGSACTRTILSDAATEATVHYSCAGAGWGRTTVRAASSTSVRIDTQGIADNAPFAYVAEAHRTGDCATPTRTGLIR